MLPKKGKVIPYASEIARGLRMGLGDTHRGIKIVMRWTGASERTVKNWFTGASGPSGEHLVALIRNSDEVLETCLTLAGREHTIVALKLIDARDRLIDTVALIQRLIDRIDGARTSDP